MSLNCPKYRISSVKIFNFQANVLEYNLPLSHPIPDHPLSYSDHEAVCSRIKVTISENQPNSSNSHSNASENGLIEALSEAINVCQDNLEHLRSHKTTYFKMAVAVLLILLCSMDMVPPYGLKTMFTVLRIVVSGLLLFLVFMATLWNSIEVNGILSGKLAMEIVLRNVVHDEN